MKNYLARFKQYALRLGAGLGILLVLSGTAAGFGADFNIRLLTDSTPDFTDIESYTRSITDNFTTPQAKAIAIWRWGRRNRHQTSCAWEDGRMIWDPILHFNSYGYMNCGIISALNATVALQAGFQARYIELGDHTVSEFSWDKGRAWHLFDSSMSIYCFNHQGIVASCEEIKSAAACELSGGISEPGHFYFYHPALACASHLGPTGWRSASDNPVEFQRTLKAGADSYTDGFSVAQYSQMAQWGRRYLLNLRPYQTYTRYWKPLGTGLPYVRPARGEKDWDNPAKNSITRAVRGNGRWDFRPNLGAKDWRDFVYDHENLDVRPAAPYFTPLRPGRLCHVVFKVDAANVITSMKIEAGTQCTGPGSSLRILLSRDGGINWKEVGKAQGKGRETLLLELGEEAAGHTEALVKFEMQRGEGGTCGLDSLAISTVTQVNRLTLPRLSRGPNRVQLRLGDQMENLVLWPALHAGAYKQTAHEEQALYTQKETDAFYRSTLGAGSNNLPGHIVWRLPVPGDITQLTVGTRVCNRGSGHVSLQSSWDGKDYQEFYRKNDGASPFDLMVLRELRPAGATRCAWVRGEFFAKHSAATYNTPGIQDIFMQVSYQPSVQRFRPLLVTFCWTEHRQDGDVECVHTQLVRSPAEEWEIQVGGFRDPTMQWIRLRLQDESAESSPVKLGYARQPLPVSPPPKPLIYQWGENVARHAAYTASRSACDANGDEAGKELTNDIIVPPSDYFTSRWPELLRASTAGWDGEVTFTVDLGRITDIGGMRIHTHQPNAQYCHPHHVAVSVSSDAQHWQPVGQVTHDDLWNPPGDYEPWELEDDPRFSGLPAAGRLAYGFPLKCQPIQARYVRFHCFPLPGKGIGLSELQVFDRVEVQPAPAAIALPPLLQATTKTR